MKWSQLFEASSFAGWGLILNGAHVASGGDYVTAIASAFAGIAAIIKPEGIAH